MLKPQANYIIGNIGNMKNKKGFTLLEVLVAVVVFVVVILIASTLFISAIQAQRYNLAYQELLDQTSYVMEYMSRKIRMAKKATDSACILEGSNYESISSDYIKFIDQDGNCIKFLLNSGQLMEEKNTETAMPLTSPYLTINGFNVAIIGDELNRQPRVTLSLEITGKEDTSIDIQTSISQRDLNY